MVARTRSYDYRVGTIGSNYVTSTGITTYKSASNGEYCTTDDTVGQRLMVNPFNLYRRFVQRAQFSGTNVNSQGKVLRVVEAWPSGNVNPPDPNTPFGSLDITAQRALLIQAISATNPGQAHVSLPTSIGELKDLPSLVRPFGQMAQRYGEVAKLSSLKQLRHLPSLLHGFGNTLLGASASGYISWRWAVKPMIRDVQSLLSMMEAIQAQNRRIERLARGEQIRRKIRVRSGKVIVNESDFTLVSEIGAVVSAKRRVVYDEKVWASIRWKSSPGSYKTPYLTPVDTFNRARRLTLGITSFEALRTAWELMPWSWFVDWWHSFGDQIALANNTIPCYWSDLCIMRTTRSERVYSIKPETVPSWLSVDAVASEWAERKVRVLDTALWFPPLPPANFPLLDSRKWSILGALYCTSVDRGLPGIFRRRQLG